MKIYALHGFLGKPSDWNILPFKNYIAVDLFAAPISPFWEWAKEFNKTVARDSAKERLLIGYSLGGRLALHALIDDPTLWSRAIICSSHAGLENVKDREARKVHDEHWAERFLTEAWESLMFDWNRQNVFKGSTELVRREGDFDRSHLNSALKIWSLGNQEFIVPYLKLLKVPITWIAGEYDKKYSCLAKEYACQIDSCSYHIVAQAGHRLLFDRPNFLANLYPFY